MLSRSSFEKISLWIVKVGLWLIPILPLYISPSMLFPFITGKNFTFRIITEFIFIFWAGLAILREEYRPRLTLLLKTITIFTGIVFLADLFSPSPYRAFFSNYERMEGFMMLGHLYLYFLILTSVFKTRRDWLIFFLVTLGASVIVSFIALLQKFGYRVSLQGGFRVDSTIGNPTYLASYLVFHVWLTLIMFREFWERWWLRLIFLGILLFELLIIYFTATRGAVLALLVVSVPFLAVIFWWWPRVSPKAVLGRKLVMFFLAVFILIPVIFWQLRNLDSVRKNSVLGRLTSYSFQERTIQSRFMIWGMSWRAALERPILGWGQENYYLVFQKYFNPGLYAQEPWFDRSHNIFFDWLVHTGFLGLISFFSIFAVAFRGLLSALRRSASFFWQGTILVSAFVTYLLQNIFVFDNLNTYLLLFSFLAYTNNFANNPQIHDNSRTKIFSSNLYPRAYVAVAILFTAFLAGGYFLNWKPIQESKALVRALAAYQFKVPADQVMAEFQKALSYKSFGDTEVREQLANIARTVPENSWFKPEEKKQFVEWALSEMRKETNRPAKDIKHMIFLASVLDRSLSFNPSYALESEKILQEAIRLSPTKQILYFELAQFYHVTAKTDQAIEALRRAWYLDKNFTEAATNLLLLGSLAKKSDVVAEVKAGLNVKIITHGGLLENMANSYQRVEEFEGAAMIYERLLELSPQNAQYHATYAALLAKIGRVEEARKHTEEAARLDPANFQKEAEIFLKMLKPR